MTSDELQQLRLEKWQALAGLGLSSERLLEFIQEVGFCPFTAQPGLPLPALDSLAGEPVGAHDAPLRPLTAEERSLATTQELLEYHLRHLNVVEIDLWRPLRLYVPAELLGYLYVSVGDRKPEKDFEAQRRKGVLSGLAAEMYQLLLEHDRLSRHRLREKLGTHRTSVMSVDHAAAELTATLKILRSGREDGDPVWRPLHRAFPDVVPMLQQVSKLQAAAALLTRFLDLVLVATEETMGEFFSPVFPRSRTHSVLIGLETGREIVPESLDGRPAWRLAHAGRLDRAQG